MRPLYSASECIPWLVVLIIECMAIVILNTITVVVFVKKKRQLQRRSTYLIIHLAMVDLLVGVVSGPLQIEIRMSQSPSMERKDYFVSAFIFCICIFILVHFPYKSYCCFLRTATRHILSS